LTICASRGDLEVPLRRRAGDPQRHPARSSCRTGASSSLIGWPWAITISVSLATIELEPVAGGTRFVHRTRRLLRRSRCCEEPRGGQPRPARSPGQGARSGGL